MGGRGREVFQPQVIGGGPTGSPVPYRNVDPAARDYLSQYGYLRGAGAVMGTVPSLGLPNAGSAGPNWSSANQSQTPPAAPGAPVAPGGGDDGCCG